MAVPFVLIKLLSVALAVAAEEVASVEAAEAEDMVAVEVVVEGIAEVEVVMVCLMVSVSLLYMC